jgi:hypothetical protein
LYFEDGPLSAPFSPGDVSTWGNTGEKVDVRALRRYSSWLAVGLNTAEWLAIALGVAIALAMGGTLAYLNFENVIFTDGTDQACVLDGSTGVISNVQ